jgi:hypothetical protein
MVQAREWHAPLLTLSSERIARERRDMWAQDESDRRWSRIVGRAVLKAAAWYAFGLLLIGFALNTTNYDLASVLYVVGMFVCALGHTMTAVRFWIAECH